ncbi:DNA excision repair protein ERCC-8 [Geodia barretti]|uniref:DNA excision repair protein ERCC-8 n=1 Tax=Geodia barretti TaxID=519541 RepID=A0AA35R6Y7_GEOBA|nr:DNA excision repair protein ERCC-8 [Geodia barretti]
MVHRQNHTDTSHAVSVVQWFPHDTGIFTTTSGDRYLKIWDTNDLLVVEKFKFKNPIYTHVMSTGTSHTLTAVGGGECKITLCDLVSGASSHVLEGHSKPVMALAWSTACEHVLASGSQDNSVVLWDIRKANGPLTKLDQHNGSRASSDPSVTVAHGGSVNGLCFSPDGLHLVSFGTDDRLRLWDAVTGKNTLVHQTPISFLLSFSNSNLLFLNQKVNYGRVFNTLPKQNCPLAFSPLSSTLHPIICIPVGGEVLMFHLTTGKKVKSLSGHFGKVHSLAVHPVEQELYSGGTDANILCWMPPPPRKPSLDRARRSNATGAVYEDAWSSDEDNDDDGRH